jgi:hypothetical protein
MLQSEHNLSSRGREQLLQQYRRVTLRTGTFDRERFNAARSRGYRVTVRRRRRIGSAEPDKIAEFFFDARIYRNANPSNSPETQTATGFAKRILRRDSRRWSRPARSTCPRSFCRRIRKTAQAAAKPGASDFAVPESGATQRARLQATDSCHSLNEAAARRIGFCLLAR